MSRVLTVTNLKTRFNTPEGEVSAVNDVSFYINESETLGVVGESGSGKSQVFMSVMGLLAKNGKATGSVRYRETEILGMPVHELNGVRGVHIGMIFQDPMTSLNPFLTVAKQMTEVLIEHKGTNMEVARKKALDMLDSVGIPEAERRLDQYPHELSGGMRQRVMIAMALLTEPDLLIADEPSTALDVTIQAQILELLADLNKRLKTAIILITHDLGVVAGLCNRVMVMYGGRIVEQADVNSLYYSPRHPYTSGMLHAMPRLDAAGNRTLTSIPGQPPNLQHLPTGCAFHPRCPAAQDRCKQETPKLREAVSGHFTACHFDDISDTIWS